MPFLILSLEHIGKKAKHLPIDSISHSHNSVLSSQFNESLNLPRRQQILLSLSASVSLNLSTSFIFQAISMAVQRGNVQCVYGETAFEELDEIFYIIPPNSIFQNYLDLLNVNKNIQYMNENEKKKMMHGFAQIFIICFNEYACMHHCVSFPNFSFLQNKATYRSSFGLKYIFGGQVFYLSRNLMLRPFEFLAACSGFVWVGTAEEDRLCILL